MVVLNSFVVVVAIKEEPTFNLFSDLCLASFMTPEFDSGRKGKSLCWGLIEISHVLVGPKYRDRIRSRWCRPSSREPMGVLTSSAKKKNPKAFREPGTQR